MNRISICNWRVQRAEPSGLHLWFDPSTELPALFTRHPDSEPALLDLPLGVDLASDDGYLDRVVSVGALETETRALRGNEAMDLLELTDPPQGVMLDHG